MKPPIEKPSEQVMRFFTPELYLQYNSPNDGEADRADEAWEAAIRAYQQHLDGLRDKMPSQVVRLSELCLHDAELLACEEKAEPLFRLPPEPYWLDPIWSAVAILSVRQGGEVLSLIYLLGDHLRDHPPKDDWSFSKLRKHWLYDEIDLAPSPRGTFQHRVLFSDGAVLEIPFLSVVTHRFPLQTSVGNELHKQSA